MTPRRKQQAERDSVTGAILAPLREQMNTSREHARHLDTRAQVARVELDASTRQIAADMRQAWDAQLPAADRAASMVRAGPGRFGVRRARLTDAQSQPREWARVWEPVLGDEIGQISVRPAAFPALAEPVATGIENHSHRAAQRARPGLQSHLDVAAAGRARADAARDRYYDTLQRLRDRYGQVLSYDTGAADKIPAPTTEIEDAHRRIAAAETRVRALETDPALTSRVDAAQLLDNARAQWAARRGVDALLAVARHDDAARPRLSRDEHRVQQHIQTPRHEQTRSGISR